MECDYMETIEGTEKAVAFLKPLVLERPTGKKWWEYAGLQSMMED